MIFDAKRRKSKTHYREKKTEKELREMPALKGRVFREKKTSKVSRLIWGRLSPPTRGEGRKLFRREKEVSSCLGGHERGGFAKKKGDAAPSRLPQRKRSSR